MHSKHPYFPKHSFVFFGGGGGGAGAIASAPVPTPAPPVEPTDQAVIMAEHDLASQNLLKKSVKNTIHAGDQVYQPGVGVAGQPSSPAGYKAKLG